MEHHPIYAVRPLIPVFPEPDYFTPEQKRWILVRDNSVVYLQDPVSGTILMKNPLPTGLIRGEQVYLGTQDGCIYFAAEISAGISLPDRWQTLPVRELSGKVPDNDMAIASYAVRILDFDRSTAFCGRCGAKTRQLTTERARICTACNRITYPRISPAIIVLIKKEDKILLARSPRSPPGLFAIIAGFNEPGENLEQTIHREVSEEVGIMVRNILYFGSEPWPFPDSLMIGFVADYAGGEIRVDNQEIETAGWFSRNNLPLIPSKASITRSLIEAWIQGDV